MNTLSPIVPDLTPALASISLGVVEAAYARDVRILGKLRKEIGTLRALVREVSKQVGSPSARLREESPESLDETVSSLLRTERQVAHLRGRLRDAGRHAQAWSRANGTGHMAVLRRTAQDADQMFLEFLRVLRDIRWDVMAVRADREPSADGPVFSTTAELRAFFDALPAGQDAA